MPIPQSILNSQNYNTSTLELKTQNKKKKNQGRISFFICRKMRKKKQQQKKKKLKNRRGRSKQSIIETRMTSGDKTRMNEEKSARINVEVMG